MTSRLCGLVLCMDNVGSLRKVWRFPPLSYFGGQLYFDVIYASHGPPTRSTQCVSSWNRLRHLQTSPQPISQRF